MSTENGLLRIEVNGVWSEDDFVQLSTNVQTAYNLINMFDFFSEKLWKESGGGIKSFTDIWNNILDGYSADIDKREDTPEKIKERLIQITLLNNQLGLGSSENNIYVVNNSLRRIMTRRNIADASSIAISHTLPIQIQRLQYIDLSGIGEWLGKWNIVKIIADSIIECKKIEADIIINSNNTGIEKEKILSQERIEMAKLKLERDKLKYSLAPHLAQKVRAMPILQNPVETERMLQEATSQVDQSISAIASDPRVLSATVTSPDKSKVSQPPTMK